MGRVSHPASLTFAIVSTTARAEHDLADLSTALGRSLGIEVIPLLLPSYARLEEEARSDRALIMWAPPRVAIDLEDEGLATIDVCCSRGGGRDSYHSALFTQHTSKIEKLADLKGCHAAWVDEHSTAGYLLPRVRIAAEGLDPDTLFGRQSFLGSHARVAAAVLAGEADVGATYLSLDPKTGRPLSAGWLDAGAGINGAFILTSAGPIPTDAIAFSRRIPADLLPSVVAEVLSLARALPEPVGRLFGADGFVPAPPLHYQGLREVLAIGKVGSAPAAR